MKRLVKTIITTLSILGLGLFIVFYPYLHYRYFSSANTELTVGITYFYESDTEDMIMESIKRFSEIGIKVVRVPLWCDPNDFNSLANNRTNAFYNWIRYYGTVNVSVAIGFGADENYIKYYLQRWGQHITYIQLLNEPEVQNSWSEGAYYLDEEIVFEFLRIKNVTDSFNLSVKYYTNFSPGFILRPNVAVVLSRYLDFVGFDTYWNSLYYLNPQFVDWLRKLTNKEVIISEFGSADLDDNVQSDFIVNSLNLFKNMGLKHAWIFAWGGSGVFGSYSIRNRLAEQKVADWIARQI